MEEEEDETLETTAILVRARERNSVMRNAELVGLYTLVAEWLRFSITQFNCLGSNPVQVRNIQRVESSLFQINDASSPLNSSLPKHVDILNVKEVRNLQNPNL
uniref:Uncharacterized protein n=1 Tax=Meloidogyne incognita TaxID=6306 RepID=A0A914L3J2_MELIC